MIMHPKRLIQILKDSVDGFTQDNVREALSFLVDYSDSRNLIVPIENNMIKIIETNNIFCVKEPKKGKVYIHTLKEIIEFKSSSYDLLEYLDKKCESFKYLNNGLVVNTNKVVRYHEYLRKLYFVNGDYVDITGAAMIYIMKNVLGKECALSQDTFIVNLNTLPT
jgi:hypothetical protein